MQVFGQPRLLRPRPLQHVCSPSGGADLGVEAHDKTVGRKPEKAVQRRAFNRRIDVVGSQLAARLLDAFSSLLIDLASFAHKRLLILAGIGEVIVGEFLRVFVRGSWAR